MNRAEPIIPEEDDVFLGDEVAAPNNDQLPDANDDLD